MNTGITRRIIVIKSNNESTNSRSSCPIHPKNNDKNTIKFFRKNMKNAAATKRSLLSRVVLNALMPNINRTRDNNEISKIIANMVISPLVNIKNLQYHLVLKHKKNYEIFNCNKIHRTITK